ncbi:MAG: trigger factor [Acidimicrobiia bacterium]
MNTEIEHLADNNIRLTITVPEQEFEKSIDEAFKKLATQVRLPGFRPGKAPRKLLEKQIGYEAGRAQAINDSLPKYYIDAVDENDIDPVDYPELKVNSGEEEGDVVFEATVAVRPVVKITGYDKLEVQVDVEAIDDESINKQLDSLRERHGELKDSEDAIADGSYATIDISGSIEGEAVPGLTANDYLYSVGSGIIGEELDKQLIGKKVGDTATFTDVLSDQFGENAGKEVEFEIEIKNVQNKVLPEATDEWIKENTDFATLDEWKEDTKKRMGNLQVLQAQMQAQQKVMEALAELVGEDVPKAFLDREIASRKESIAHQSGVDVAQLEAYLDSLDETARSEFEENVEKDAIAAIKSDLAVRAIIEAEKLDATDEELEEEIEKFAATSKEKINKIRNRVKKPGVEKQVRLDIAKSKALKLVMDNAVGKDAQGNEIALQIPNQDGEDILSALSAVQDHDHDHDHDHQHDHEHDHDHKH